MSPGRPHRHPTSPGAEPTPARPEGGVTRLQTRAPPPPSRAIVRRGPLRRPRGRALATKDEAWRVEPDVPTAVVVDAHRREIAAADAIIAVTPLDAEPAWWPEDLFGDWRIDNLRQVMLHMIAEVACHAGHLDAARELIDGRQWLVLTD
ncbi:MAG: DUF664 domain-containing protein [Lapillicoccus sp.]